jgi:hypothetical protein
VVTEQLGVEALPAASLVTHSHDVGDQDMAEGPPLRRSNFNRRVWQPACAAVGLRSFHFHDLRHSGNTLAASTGASLKELMHRMGHSSPRAALIYQHATAKWRRWDSNPRPPACKFGPTGSPWTLTDKKGSSEGVSCDRRTRVDGHGCAIDVR